MLVEEGSCNDFGAVPGACLVFLTFYRLTMTGTRFSAAASYGEEETELTDYHV